MLTGMDAAVSREGPYDRFVLGNLTAKHCFTLFLWCLILGISPLVFSSDWYLLAITGSINFLPYFIAESLMIWPWTSVVISGVIFTIQRSDGISASKITESTHLKCEGEERGGDQCAEECFANLNLILEEYHRAECAKKQSLRTIDCGSWIISFISGLLMCHLTIIFMSLFLSWIDILMIGFQYRALLFIFAIAFLSLLLIVTFVGLSAEWLRAWSSSSDQQLRLSDHIRTRNEDTVSNCLVQLVPTESLYAEVFVQTEDIIDKSLSNQNMEDGDFLSCDEMEQIELEELLTELTEVTEWFNFGVNLEIPEARLKEIEQKCESVESCKREMLTAWMRITSPTWKAIVIALAGIDMKDLALKIASKYGVSFPLSLRDIIHQLEHTHPDSEQPMSSDPGLLISDNDSADCNADSSSVSSQEVQFQMTVNIALSNEPSALETATNDNLRVSQDEISDGDTQPLLDLPISISFHEVPAPPPNECSVYETTRNDTEHVSEHDVFDDNTHNQLLEDLPMEVSVTPPNEANISISDMEQVCEHEIPDDNTQFLQDLPTEVSIPPPNKANVSISDAEQVNEQEDSNDNTQPLEGLPSTASYDEIHEKVEWVPDGKVKECFYCQTKFTAIKRKHHCRSCGQIFCNTCSKHKIVLMHLGSLKRERVCDECYRKYKSGEVLNSVHEKEEDEYVLIT